MIWFYVFNWLGVVLNIPHRFFQFFSQFCSLGKGPGKKNYIVIDLVFGHLVCLRTLNGVIFSGNSCDFLSLIDRINVTSQRWFLVKTNSVPYIFIFWLVYWSQRLHCSTWLACNRCEEWPYCLCSFESRNSTKVLLSCLLILLFGL